METQSAAASWKHRITWIDSHDNAKVAHIDSDHIWITTSYTLAGEVIEVSERVTRKMSAVRAYLGY